VYRGTSKTTEEVVLRRPSRSRVRRNVLVGVAVTIAAVVVVVGVGADRVVPVVTTAAGVAFGLALLTAAFRTRSLVVARAGGELRVRSGRKRSTFLLAEVRDVQVEPVSVRAHAVVLLLKDGRRVPLGDPYEAMRDATAETRALREALRS